MKERSRDPPLQTNFFREEQNNKIKKGVFYEKAT